jgi:phosphopentomutase
MMGIIKDIMISECAEWHEKMYNIYNETDDIVDFMNKAYEYKELGIRANVMDAEPEMGQLCDVDSYEEYLNEFYDDTLAEDLANRYIEAQGEEPTS